MTTVQQKATLVVGRSMESRPCARCCFFSYALVMLVDRLFEQWLLVESMLPWVNTIHMLKYSCLQKLRQTPFGHVHDVAKHVVQNLPKDGYMHACAHATICSKDFDDLRMEASSSHFWSLQQDRDMVKLQSDLVSITSVCMYMRNVWVHRHLSRFVHVCKLQTCFTTKHWSFREVKKLVDEAYDAEADSADRKAKGMGTYVSAHMHVHLSWWLNVL